MNVELRDEISELQPAKSQQAWARLLLIRCRMLDVIASTTAERHQTLVIDWLLRTLTRSFGSRDLVVQLNQSDILVVLRTQGVNVATVLIREAIAEVRTNLLGERERQEEFSIEAISVRPGATLDTLPLLAIAEQGPTIAPFSAAPDQAAEMVLGDPLQIGTLRYYFSPVRDVRHKAITTYFLHCHGSRGGEDRDGYELLHGGENSSLVSTIDLQVIKRAQAELQPYISTKAPYMLAWFLHVRTLDSPADFQRYSKVLSSLGDFARERIAIKLVGMTSDWPVSRMQSTIGMLRKHVKIIAVQVHLDWKNLPALRECGAANVCVDLSGERSEGDLLPRLHRFCEAANRAYLVTIAESVASRSVAAMAISAGFRHVHVSYLGERQHRTQAAAQFDLADLFALPAT